MAVVVVVLLLHGMGQGFKLDFGINHLIMIW
jgi:hypothetical protein